MLWINLDKCHEWNDGPLLNGLKKVRVLRVLGVY